MKPSEITVIERVVQSPVIDVVPLKKNGYVDDVGQPGSYKSILQTIIAQNAQIILSQESLKEKYDDLTDKLDEIVEKLANMDLPSGPGFSFDS